MPNETDIIEFEPGIITAVIRCENDSLRYNDSYDYGVTWQGSQPAQITPYDWNPCKPESIYVGNGRVMTLMRTDGQGGFEQSFMTSYDRAHSYRYAQRYDQRIASMYTELKHVESRGLIIGVSAVIRSTGPTYELWFDVWRTGSARVHNIDHNPEAPLNTNSALVLCESSDASSLSWTNQVGSDILHTGPLALTEGRGYHGENYLSDFSLLNYGEYPGDVKFLHNGDPWSIVVRFRCSDFSSNSGILQTGHSDVHVGINFRMQGGGDRAVQLNIYNGNAGLQPLSVTTRDGTIAEYPKWNTMVIRYDPATVMYTIINNGVISHTPPWATGNAFSTSSPTYSLRVGRGTDVEISHLEIFSEAFTDSELSAISGLLLGSDK